MHLPAGVVVATAVVGLLGRLPLGLASLSNDSFELVNGRQSRVERDRGSSDAGEGSGVAGRARFDTYGGTGDGYGGDGYGGYGEPGGGGGYGDEGYSGKGRPVVIVHRTKGGRGGGYSGGGKDKGRGCTVCSVLAPLALLGSLLPLLSFGYVTVSTGRRRRRREADDYRVDEKLKNFIQVQKYVHENLESNPQDDIVAKYLSCSGMSDANNHCLEHLVCSFDDPTFSHSHVERAAISAILHAVMQNQRVSPEVKSRLKAAGEAGRRQPGSCRRYTCTLPSAPSPPTATPSPHPAHITLHDHLDAHADFSDNHSDVSDDHSNDVYDLSVKQINVHYSPDLQNGVSHHSDSHTDVQDYNDDHSNVHGLSVAHNNFHRHPDAHTQEGGNPPPHNELALGAEIFESSREGGSTTVKHRNTSWDS